jgi:hypothetical protein
LILVTCTFAAICGSAAIAAPRNADGLPSLTFSVAADYSAGTVREGGPLFDKAIAAFKLANEGNGEKFATRLTTDADLTIARNAQEKLPLTVEVIQAATKSCVGPFPYDEGSSWAQFSWVCRDDQAAPISKFVTVRDTPELIVSVWFEGDKIKRINATEPLPWPGQRKFQIGTVPATWTPK